MWNETLLKETEKRKGPGFALKDIIEMDKIAQRIQESVNSVLGLEQNEANISEAESARKQTEETIDQGRTLMLFTIITIIFLPMSFLASLFALNVTVFPHTDQNLVYEPQFIFSVIFGITTVISIPAIGYARYKHQFYDIPRWIRASVTGIIDIFKFSSIKGEPSASTSKSSEQELPDVSPTGTPQSKTDVQQPHSQAQHPKSRTETGNLNGNNRPMDGTKRRSVHFSEPATQEEKELAQGRGELDVPRLGVIGRTTSHIRHAFRSNASPLNPTNDEETGLKK